MLEWLKRHVWKACGRQKRLQGSNPCLSANGANALIFNKLDAKLDLKRDKIGTSVAGDGDIEPELFFCDSLGHDTKIAAFRQP